MRILLKELVEEGIKVTPRLQYFVNSLIYTCGQYHEARISKEGTLDIIKKFIIENKEIILLDPMET